MCKSKSHGGARCANPAHRRAVYAVRKALKAAATSPAKDTETPTGMHRVPARTFSPDLPDGLPSQQEHVEALRELRQSIVSDDAPPDAGVRFYADLVQQRATAEAAGMSADHTWSPSMMGALKAEADKRRCKVLGWYCGPGQWAGQGREVLPGAEPFTVNVPVVTDAGTEWSVHPVWDWTQTRRVDGEADPTWTHAVPGTSEELFDRLVASSPIPVEIIMDGSLGKAHGSTAGATIKVDGRLAVGDRAHSLAHELSHVWLRHPERISTGMAQRAHTEQEAEMGAYLVLTALDLGDDTTAAVRANTAEYLRGWVQKDGVTVTDDKLRWQMLQVRATPATGAAVRILTCLQTVGEGGRLPWDEDPDAVAAA